MVVALAASILVALDATAVTPKPYVALPPIDFMPLVTDPPPQPTPLGIATIPAVPTLRATPAPPMPPRPAPQPSGPRPPSSATSSLSGKATFYAYVPGGAAAGAGLRAAMGPRWRGRHVLVCYRSHCLTVVLSDYESSKLPHKIIDLNEGTFAALVGPGWAAQGVAWVTVRWSDV